MHLDKKKLSRPYNMFIRRKARDLFQLLVDSSEREERERESKKIPQISAGLKIFLYRFCVCLNESSVFPQRLLGMLLHSSAVVRRRDEGQIGGKRHSSAHVNIFMGLDRDHKLDPNTAPTCRYQSQVLETSLSSQSQS